MARLKELTEFLNDTLALTKFSSDVSNNGLQFEGAREVTKALFAVDASNALFCTAADLDADFIFVHHGISWGSSLKRIVSLDSKRVSLLAVNSISLYAAHLPLDAHPEIGHNALLSKMLKLTDLQTYAEYDGLEVGFEGILEKEMSVKEIAGVFDRALVSESPYQIFGDPGRKVSHIGVISGGGAFPAAFSEAYDRGIECLVTGEMGHSAYHYAMEAGVSVLSLGHYRSETPGVIALMELVKARFNLEAEFVDLPTGM